MPFVQLPKGSQVPLELAVDAVALALGAGLFAMAFLIGKLQDAAAAERD